MKKILEKLNENQSIMLLTAIAIVVVAFIFLPFCFVFSNIPVLFAILWGWLLGGAISISVYGLLVRQINGLAVDDDKIRLRAAGLHYIRLALYALGLLLAGLLYYFGIPVINIFAVAAGYMPIRLFVMIYRRKIKVTK
jgi:hypothetical protein